MTTTAPAERQRRSRANRPTPQAAANLAALSRQPAELTLDDYKRVDHGVVTKLVQEFGEVGALRILNSARRPTPKPAPFDRGLVAPPGAVAIPRSEVRRWRPQGGA